MPSRLTSRKARYDAQKLHAQSAWAKVAAAAAQTVAQSAAAGAEDNVRGGVTSATLKSLEDRLNTAGIP